MPLVTTTTVAVTLQTYLDDADLDLEVFTEFPADEATASEGMYVARLYQEQRNKIVATLQLHGTTYEVVDRLELYLIQGQSNPFTDDYLNLIGTFIDDPLFEGYHWREFTEEQLYRDNSESYRIILSLTRFQTIT